MALDIQIVSDLHLEFVADKKKLVCFKQSAKVLALLGDTCCVASDEDFDLFKKFIIEIIPLYEHIIMVSGNHEYYNDSKKRNVNTEAIQTMSMCNDKIKNFFKQTSRKLYYLNNSSISMNINNNSYLVIGSTLWSNIPEEKTEIIKEMMSDYKYIYIDDEKGKPRKIIPSDINGIFKTNYRFIKTQIKKAEQFKMKAIVLTHHCPFISLKGPRRKTDTAYMTDCTELIRPPVVLWAWGHRHINEHFKMNNVIMYSNCKGYPREKTEFSQDNIIKI